MVNQSFCTLATLVCTLLLALRVLALPNNAQAWRVRTIHPAPADGSGERDPARARCAGVNLCDGWLVAVVAALTSALSMVN